MRYFTLQSDTVEYRMDADDAGIMSLGPLRLPEYLDRSQIVSRGAGNALIVDDFNRWAEPLDKTVHRVVANQVDAMLEGVVVVAYPSTSMIDPDIRMIGRITRFDSDSRGLAVLEVQWGAATSDAEVLVSPRRTRYTSQASSVGDADSVVAALNNTLHQFSRDIANNLRAALEEHASASVEDNN